MLGEFTFDGDIFEDEDSLSLERNSKIKERAVHVPQHIPKEYIRDKTRFTKKELRIKALNRRRPGLLSDVPTNILILINAGATGDIGGVFSDEIAEVFGHLPGFKHLEMGLGKPWSFVVCDSVESAIQIRNQVDDTVVSSGNGTKKLWIEFAQKLTSDIVIHDPEIIKNKIPGLYVFPDAISKEEEKYLLDEMMKSVHEDSLEKLENDKLDNTQSSHWISLLKRRVRHYGYHFDYPTMTTSSICELPRYVRSMVNYITSLNIFTKEQLDPNTDEGQDNLLMHKLDQLTINEYWPGAGIGVHTDRHSQFKGPILIVSLRGGVVMEFSPYKEDRREITAAKHIKKIDSENYRYRSKKNGFSNVFDSETNDNDDIVQVYLPARSLTVMSGDSRYSWTHAIRARKTDIINGKACARENRVSFTFRYVRRPADKPCNCGLKCCD